jgi:hypothetical protein
MEAIISMICPDSMKSWRFITKMFVRSLKKLKREPKMRLKRLRLTSNSLAGSYIIQR